MTLGTRLGPYEICAQIGEGGMGQVYQATDTNLKRSVAIKGIPEAVAADPERLARFQREAEALARLNHPHIAQIHGLEKSDGTTALVMELVEGPTLADRIARVPIPLDGALAIAKQIAEALEAAHEQGIVHRDLKPANVKVGPDGTVKVLDFGLAKIVAGDAHTDVANSPTVTGMATHAGVLLGTAAYMSPEQARGEMVDERTDLWAFGAVLDRNADGPACVRRKCNLGHPSERIAGRARSAVLPRNTPASIRTLLRRCLAKERRHRLNSAAAARLEIEDAMQALNDPRAASATAPTTSRRSFIGAALAVGAIAAATVWMLTRPDTLARPSTSRFTIVPRPASHSPSRVFCETLRSRRAIPTDILEFRGRVLVIQAARGEGRLRAALISDTVLPVYSGDRAIRLSWAVVSRRTGPRVPVVGCR